VDDGPLIVDTDLLIDFLRGRGPGADAVEGWLRAARLRVAAVTAYELRLGADFLRRETPITRLIAERTLPLDLAAALQAGAVATALRARGTPIGVRDTLIGGICLRFGLPLATRNVAHFSRVEGLVLADLAA